MYLCDEDTIHVIMYYIFNFLLYPPCFHYNLYGIFFGLPPSVINNIEQNSLSGYFWEFWVCLEFLDHFLMTSLGRSEKSF